MVYNAVDELTSWPGIGSYYGYYDARYTQPDGSLRRVLNGQATEIGSYTYYYSGLMNGCTYRMQISVDVDHPFRGKPITYFG